VLGVKLLLKIFPLDYEYTLFDITAVDSQLGGSGAYVEYDLSDYLEVGDYPGNIQTVTGAYVTPENYFPIFDVKLTVKDFFEGERARALLKLRCSDETPFGKIGLNA